MPIETISLEQYKEEQRAKLIARELEALKADFKKIGQGLRDNITSELRKSLDTLLAPVVETSTITIHAPDVDSFRASSAQASKINEDWACSFQKLAENDAAMVATLAPNEAVIPLSNGRFVPVAMDEKLDAAWKRFNESKEVGRHDQSFAVRLRQEAQEKGLPDPLAKRVIEKTIDQQAGIKRFLDDLRNQGVIDDQPSVILAETKACVDELREVAAEHMIAREDAWEAQATTEGHAGMFASPAFEDAWAELERAFAEEEFQIATPGAGFTDAYHHYQDQCRIAAEIKAERARREAERQTKAHNRMLLSIKNDGDAGWRFGLGGGFHLGAITDIKIQLDAGHLPKVTVGLESIAPSVMHVPAQWEIGLCSLQRLAAAYDYSLMPVRLPEGMKSITIPNSTRNTVIITTTGKAMNSGEEWSFEFEDGAKLPPVEGLELNIQGPDGRAKATFRLLDIGESYSAEQVRCYFDFNLVQEIALSSGFFLSKN